MASSTDSTTAGALLRSARLSAGLTQRAVAERAGTAQSVVARVESGVTDPSVGTLRRLMAATGHDLALTASPSPVFDPQLLDDVPRILAMTPAERLREVANLSRFMAMVHRV